jgi:hypothetical protein
MLPLISEGSMVSLHHIPPVGIVPGDIAALRIDGELYLHRILEVGREGGSLVFREKGDSQLFSTWVPEDRYEGKAVWMFTRGGRRHLGVDGASFRIRTLTFLSKLEADILELPRRLRGRPVGASVPGGRWLAGVFRLVTLPFKLLAAPLLLSVYGTEARGEPAAEERVLLRWVREAVGSKVEQGSLFPKGEADRHLLHSAASSQGVAAFVAGSVGGGLLPLAEAEELLADLKPLVHRTALKSLEARQTVGDVAEIFREEGIEYAVIKGPALSMTLYGQESLRPASDVDVLVRRRERERAVAALGRRGYLQKSRGFVGSLLGWGHFHYALHPRHKGRLPVELHWELVDRANLYRLPEEEFFESLWEVKSGGVTFSTLAGEDHFLYLCLHVAKHGLINGAGLREEKPAEWFCRSETGNRLIWFIDLLLFLKVRGGEFDWERIREKAERWNVVEDVTICLRVLKRLFPEMGAEDALGKLGVLRRVKVRKSTGGSARNLRTRVLNPLVQRSMKMDERFLFRPARLFFTGRLFFPSRSALRGFYGKNHPLPTALLRVVHPAVMTARLLGFVRR